MFIEENRKINEKIISKYLFVIKYQVLTKKLILIGNKLL